MTCKTKIASLISVTCCLRFIQLCHVYGNEHLSIQCRRQLSDSVVHRAFYRVRSLELHLYGSEALWRKMVLEHFTGLK